MSEPGILPKPIPFGKYYLLERVNVGGMAEVFKAKAFGVEGFERLLAVKQILSSIAEDESFINMFIDEAKIAGQLHHPNIAQIFDLGKVDGSYFIALEYISGKDLKTQFERARRIGEKVSIPRVCYVVMKICEGLGYAHDKKDSQGKPLNIVHRDVSPQNILTSYEGEVKIIDFGIAKAQGKTSQTQVGILKGKFSYMSPEQVRGLHVDHRSDIFSLGIVLYELLTLERLFLGESDFDTLEKIRKVEMSPPSLYNPHIPKELEDIVLKALARTPEERYQSSYDLAEALELFMRNQGYYYTNKDLAAYMKEAFSADIEFENKKLDYYRTLNLKPLTDDHTPVKGRRVPEPRPARDLEWSDDEMETQIFDRLGAEDVGESDIIYAEEANGPDLPTVEFDRWDVDLDLAPPKRTNDFAIDAEPAPRRAPQPTAQVQAVDRRERPPQVTVPSAAVLPEPRQESGSRLGVIAAVAAVVIVAGLGYFFLFHERAAVLQVEIEPEHVQIYINETLIHDGATPFTYKAPPGPASIVIRQDGFEELTRELEFERGKTYKLNQPLKPLPSESTGFAIKTTPEGATVKVGDDVREDKTPLTVSSLEAGTYAITISMEGYFDETKKIDVKKEEIAQIDVALRPAKVELTVNSNPDRSDYAIFNKGNDERVASGRTPDTVTLEGGIAYRVVVDRRGFDEWSQDFEPGTQAAPTLNAELSRTRAAEVAERTPTPRPEPPRQQPKTQPKTQPATAQPKTQPAAQPEPSGTGTVSIASRPVARVYINDQDTGRYTPLVDFKIPSGRHKIGLVNPEFGLDKTYYVDVKPGEAKRIINR